MSDPVTARMPVPPPPLSPLAHRYRQLLHWLDARLFPAVVAFATHPIHILWILVLWGLLLVCGPLTIVELVGGNYTNGLSAAASTIVLYRQLKLERAASALQTTMEDHLTILGDLHGSLQHLHDKLNLLHSHLTAGTSADRPIE